MKQVLTLALMVTLLQGCTQFKNFVELLPRSEQKVPVKHTPPTTKKPADDIYTGEVMGQIEKILIGNAELHLVEAKLDTSSSMTVLDADTREPVKEGDKEFITFDIKADDGSTQTLKKEVIRWTNGANKSRRPVVNMDVCLGNKRINGEVVLASDDHLLYPVIIGNNILKDNVVVDKTREYTATPSCQ
ncbi:MAG: hypothetical protein GC137_07535 [Alphaproteobacteria bacterium]|nr:hypothetical protein [Alphaproteobacteria bacterium]